MFDLKTETIGKLSALTFSHLMGIWWGKMLNDRGVGESLRCQDFIATVNTAIFE